MKRRDRFNERREERRWRNEISGRLENIEKREKEFAKEKEEKIRKYKMEKEMREK